MREKIVLAYSGGLDTSIIIPWLKENYDCDVIAFVADVGQGDDIEAVVEKAYATGASKVIVEDLRQEFLTDYVFPAIQAGAVYEHKYLLGTSLARPIIAKYQALAALREGYLVHVASDAVSSRTEWNWKIGLERMRAAGAVISSTEMMVYELMRSSSSPASRR